MVFRDRRDAGRALARLVATLPNLDKAIALGLPRGGVPVAYEVARACNLPLDVLVVRKIGAPGIKELAVGAVASGGIFAFNQEALRAFRLSEKDVRAMAEAELGEVARRERDYRPGFPPLTLEGHSAILIDDGLATGATMKAAVRAVRTRAEQVIIAVPVAAESSFHELESEADRLLCVFMPEVFDAVGQFYWNFEPTSDEEVRTLMLDAHRSWQARQASSHGG